MECEVVTEKDIARRCTMQIVEIAVILHDEFYRCIGIKKRGNEDQGETGNNEPEEEHTDIDIDKIYLIARRELKISQDVIEQMTFGKYCDIISAYGDLYGTSKEKAGKRDGENS